MMSIRIYGEEKRKTKKKKEEKLTKRMWRSGDVLHPAYGLWRAMAKHMIPAVNHTMKLRFFWSLYSRLSGLSF